MANRWGKEDKLAWTRSEVMQELERKVLDNMKRVEAMSQKIAQDSAAETAAKTKAIMESSTDSATKAQAVQSLADDYSDESEVVDDEANDEVTRDSMINELRQMAQDAISKGNIKVAYQIERTIEEILEDEV